MSKLDFNPKAFHPDDPSGEWDYRNILSISGGKDSTAMYLLAIEAGVEFEAIFCDVGNELKTTYDYIRELPAKAGGPPIRWLRADFTGSFPARRKNIRKRWGAEGIDPSIIDRAVANLNPTGNPFLDLCLLRSGFPSSHARFCTDYLKVQPSRSQAYRPLWDQGMVPRSWLGMRREESRARSNLGMTSAWKFNKTDPPTLVFRPMIEWDHSQLSLPRGDDQGGVWPLHLRSEGRGPVDCPPLPRGDRSDSGMGKVGVSGVQDRPSSSHVLFGIGHPWTERPHHHRHPWD